VIALLVAAGTAVGGCGTAEQDETATDREAPAASSVAANEATPAAPAQRAPGEPDDPVALSAESPGQAAAISVAALVEACFGARGDYRRCTDPRGTGAVPRPKIVAGRPGPGEAHVDAPTSRSFKVIATDETGVRWVIRRQGNAAPQRTCRLADGERCDPPTW
jgi:hypothetical protein